MPAAALLPHQLLSGGPCHVSGRATLPLPPPHPDCWPLSSLQEGAALGGDGAEDEEEDGQDRQNLRLFFIGVCVVMLFSPVTFNI